MRLIQATNRNFTSALWAISYQAKSIGEQFHRVRQLYEIHEIRNKVPDGTPSFPEDSRSLASGITVEFRYVLRSSDTPPPFFSIPEVFSALPAPRSVSFRYPSSDDFALRDVSFKIEKGQLCVSPVLLVSAWLTLGR